MVKTQVSPQILTNKPIETLTELSSLSSVWCTRHNKSPGFVPLGLTQIQIVFYKHKIHLIAISPGCICICTGYSEMT